MKTLPKLFSAAFALLLPAVAVAQQPPIAVTVPWTPASPNTPHDIISGQATRVKGAEAGREPVAGAQPFGPITSVTVESLSTCSAGAQSFTLNGVAVGTIANGWGCTCTPQIQTATTSAPAALAAWNSADLTTNVARVIRPAGEYVTWFAMTVSTGASTQRVCIYDKTGGDCDTTNLCAAYDYGVAVDRSRNFGASNGYVYSGATYSWDFGDGTPPTAPAPITAANRRFLAANHTYSGAIGSPFNARLTICDATNQCSTATYRMVIRANTQETRTNIAIDEGLWYLHTKLKASGQIQADGSYGEYLGGTAAAVNAFEAHGHLESQNRLVNPYAETIAGGLKYVFANITSGATAAQPAGNPDSNGNARWLGANVQGIYQTGMLMDAIITSATPNKVVTDGPAAGSTYGQVVQDMVDAYAMGQMDNQDARRRGSWYYEFSAGFNATNGHADNSSSGWAAIGMIPAEQNWGLTVPSFVKTENLISMQACYSGVGNECGTIGYGAIAEFGGNGCIWGCAATTPNGMVQLIMDGKGPGEIAFGTTPAFDRAARWLAENWGTGVNEADANTVTGYTYGMFAVVKALRLSGVEFLTKDSNGCAGGGTDSQFDWFNDPDRGVAAVLTGRQINSGGGAGWGRWDARGGAAPSGIATQWSLLMLATELFQQGPKAVAAANPLLVTLNPNVTFSHNQSFHLDASKQIALYEWDLDNNGTFEFSTADANATFSRTYNAIGTYTAKLRVTDNNATPLQDVSEVQVQVAVTNVPPVAVVTPVNNVVLVGTTITFDGSASFDPNAGAPLNDSVVEHAWDIDDSNGLVTFVVGGPTQAVTFNTVGTFQIALRVKDSGPGGEAQLSNVAFANIVVDRDTDGDGTPDGGDGCPADPTKTAPGTCGCGVADTDSDGDGTADCNDACADDPAKTVPGACGCGQADTDTDGDSSPDCVDTDDDGDGDPDDTDCNPLDAEINTLAQEICVDGVDNDCDGNADGSDSQCDNDGDGDPNDTDPDDDNDGVPDDGEHLCGTNPLTADNAAPTITCPAGVTVVADDACHGATQGVATVQDACEPGLAANNDGLGDQYPLGTTTVTFSVTDAGQNTVTCQQIVTVEDLAPPTVTCPDTIAASTPPDTCGAVVDVAAHVVTEDNCDQAVQHDAPGATTYPLGTTSVTVNATDAQGNPSTCVIEIIVTDETSPSIVCPAPAALEADAACRGVSADVATATDACDADVAITSDAPASYGLGLTTVTFTATDDQANRSTCERAVRVTDVTAPEPTCAPDVDVQTDAGRCVATVTVARATATDNCDAEPAVTGEAPAEFGLGASPVEFLATDDAANTRACVTTVTVTDAEAPSITCPGAITVPADATGCGTMVAVEPQSVFDNCDAEVSVSSNAPETFAVGDTLVTLTARDNFGNTSTCTVQVTVLDMTSPTVTCPPSRIADAPADACGLPVDFGALTASDNCTSDLVVTSDAPAVFPVGNTTVTFWIEDFAGNITTCDSTVVTVLDVTRPSLTCPAPVSVDADPETCRRDVPLTATATDACSVATLTGNGTESYPLGTTDHGFAATDDTGNESVCSTPVTVVDVTAPSVNAGPDFEVDANTACTANADLHGSVTDACGVARYEWRDESGALIGNTADLPVEMLGVGAHVFTLTACDVANNCASDSVTVTIATSAMSCFQVRHVNLKMSDRPGHDDDERDEDDDDEDRRSCSRSRHLHNHLYARGSFELNECNGVDLAVSGASVTVDGQTFVVPAGGFVRRGYHRYTYRSPRAEGGWWRLTIDQRHNRWSFKSWHVANDGLNTTDGLTVSLALGSQVGTETVALQRHGSSRNGYSYGFHTNRSDCSQRCRDGHRHGHSCRHSRHHHEESCGHDDDDDDDEHDEHRNRNRRDRHDD
jgi:hypothetical protein